MLTRTKAQFRAQYKRLQDEVDGKIKPKDPNKPLTTAQLKRLYETPGRLLVKLESVDERLDKGERKGLLTLLKQKRILKEQYLESQTKLAVAYNDKRYRNRLFAIRLCDTTR